MIISRSTQLVAVKKITIIKKKQQQQQQQITQINATNIYTGCSKWEREANESEGVSQSRAIFTFKVDAIECKTKISFPRSIFAGRGPSIKIATVYASKPDPRSDLIYLRFYVYSDKQDSKMVSDQMRDMDEGRVLNYA